MAEKRQIPPQPAYSEKIEQSLDVLAQSISGVESYLNPRALAIKLIEGDPIVLEEVAKQEPKVITDIKSVREALGHQFGGSADWVMSDARNQLANHIAQAVIQQGKRQTTLRDNLDQILLHPFWGYVGLVVILFVFFQIVYTVGGWFEAPLMDMFEGFEVWIEAQFSNPEGFFSQVSIGLVQGISGGVAIVLPYLVPFLIGLGILEDVGYLSRVAFMMDALMHKLGLHGKSIVPFILGFGCNVPAIMSTRILEDKRERFISAALSTLVPCAARQAIVFGLVAFYLGPGLALAIYLFDLFVIALTAKILNKFMQDDSPGLILEMPVYRVPTLRTVANKAWWRIREFIVEAWPLLIVGSVTLSVLSFINATVVFNALLRPLSWLLGLPGEVGIPLIFGVLRKELSLVMLGQALGSMTFSQVLTPVQMITYAVFVVFYVPCLATMLVIRKEMGTKAMWAVIGMTTLIATLASLLARGLASIFY